jgi:hypothetical protein
MTKRFKIALLTMLAVGAAWFAPTAKADEWNKQTVLTFNEPVEIPGQVLPAGTYIFKLVDSQSDRNIVQVFTEDQQHLLATIMAIPDYREEPADRTVVTFEERTSGSPEALHSWFYPGDTDGFEFVYSKSERQYAAQSEQPAHAAEVSETSQQIAPQQITTDLATAEQTESELPAPVVVGEEEQVIIAQAAAVEPGGDAAAANDSDSAQTSVADTLPQTAGNFASIPLMGLVLLSGGLTALRFATKQS